MFVFGAQNFESKYVFFKGKFIDAGKTDGEDGDGLFLLDIWFICWKLSFGLLYIYRDGNRVS